MSEDFLGLGLNWVLRPPLDGVGDYLKRENARAALTEDMYALLRDGKASVHDHHNVLVGHGRNVGVLSAKGLMKREGFSDGWTRYQITEAGRKALLDHLGVTEIER